MGELPGNTTPHLTQPPASDNTGKQASLTITIAICFGTLAVIFLSVLIICECQSVQGHEKEPTAGTSKYFKSHFKYTHQNINLCSFDWFLISFF